jgi:tRNA-binding EMAP/Myf-like protein
MNYLQRFTRVTSRRLFSTSENFSLFSACDFRVAKIVDCFAHPDSDKLYIEKIDIGEPELRTIGSGL